MNKNRSLALKCFSPPVMVATFVIELVLAVFVIIRYKLTARGRAILAILICLAAFQLAEYFVCTQSSIAYGASRAGYAMITFLPPLGLYLMGLLTKPLKSIALWAMFAVAFMFVGYFLLAENAFRGYECTGNYVIFQIGRAQALIYGTYYFGLIFLAVWRGLMYLENNRAIHKQATRWLLLGYILFIIPVAVLTIIQPDTKQAIPSVLCGFAVTLAIVLGTKVAPLALKKR